MGRAIPACLQDESLRISIEVLHILEAGAMRMHAHDYREAATHLHESLACAAVEELLALARSAPGVLSEAAEAVLYAYGCEDRIDTTDARRIAAFEVHRVVQRLRSSAPSRPVQGGR
ncbi:MAG TPA: hypothetical protein VLI72_14515 [Methylibium sp.]|nr:hypothetical protein [Methylibium sp.]